MSLYELRADCNTVTGILNAFESTCLKSVSEVT